MNVNLTPALEEFIAKQVASGHFNNNSEVVRAALRLLVREYERSQTEHVEHLRKALARGLDDVANGRMRPASEVVGAIRKKAAKRKGKSETTGRRSKKRA